MATVENSRNKRHWVAAIEADGERLTKDFCDGTLIKSKRIRRYELSPGFYERAWVDYSARTICETCHERKSGEMVDYFCITNADQYVPIPEAAIGWLDEIISGPLLGEDGSWNGSHCECGAPMADYDEHMFPHCEEHKPVTTIAHDKEEAPF